MLRARPLVSILVGCTILGTASFAATDRGHPSIGLRDGLALDAEYVGETSTFLRERQKGQAIPTALAAADIDGDGTTDLICGYTGAAGGYLTLHRGDPRARNPFGPRAASPFRSEARVVELPIRPDLLAAGDLDGDGQAEVLAASRDRNLLVWLEPDDPNGAGSVYSLELPGTVDALVTGEIHARDGLADLALAIHGEALSELWIFRGSHGAPMKLHETWTLPGPATALALGRLDRHAPLDLVAAVGDRLFLLHGSGPGNLPDKRVNAEPRSAYSELLSLDYSVRSIALGNFTTASRRTPQLALLAEDGAIHLLERPAGEGTPWNEVAVRRPSANLGEAAAADVELSALQISSLPTLDLALLHRGAGKLHLSLSDVKATDSVTVSGVSELVAALPLRLNDDPFDDLVILTRDAPGPTLMLTTSNLVFTVDSIADTSDAVQGDGVCADAGGDCTLRAALEEANASAGTDTIAFDLDLPGAHTIQPLSALPGVTDPVLIDGTTEPDYAGTPIVEIDGSLAGDTDGLVLWVADSVVRGLAINRFNYSGVAMNGTGAVGNRVQACYLGIGTDGITDLGNVGPGVFLLGGAQSNIIGTDGDGAADDLEGNVISGNTDGVLIIHADTDSNVVAGNLVGTDASGTVAVPNNAFGVALPDVVRFNRVGTDGDGVSDAEERNVISGNTVRGVLFAALAEQNVVAGNYIGTDITGTVALPNVEGGVEIANGARFNLLGTNADGLSDELEANVISGNLLSGITIFGTPVVEGNVIAGNLIGLQPDRVTPLGNEHHGVLVNDEASDNLIGGLGVLPGECHGPCNRIAHNGTGRSLDGVHVTTGTGITVVGNFIHDNFGGAGIDIDQAGATPNDPGDLDTGANNVQNYPILSDAVTAGGVTTIAGTLDSTPFTSFFVELYRNTAIEPNGIGEGEIRVGSVLATTDAAGIAPIVAPVTPPIPDGELITATATRMESNGKLTDTSEFSPCLAVGPAVGAGRVPDGDGMPGTQLRIDKGANPPVLELSWGASCNAGDVDYALYTGEIGDFTSHVAKYCSSGGLTTRTIRYWEGSRYYLVVPVSMTREGSYGTSSDGTPRPPGLSICRPQEIVACP